MPSDSRLSGGIRTFDWTALPRGWRFELLGQLCSIRRGASPRPAGDPLYFGGQIPWFKIGDATKERGRWLRNTEDTVNEAGAACSVRVPAGSLIVSNSGVSLGFAVLAAVEGCIHDGWLLLYDFVGADRDYLYYCINYFTPRIRGMADGTTQPNLNTGIAARLIIPLPPLPEQRAIADILEALDDRADLNRRTNETLESIARAIFKSWFVDFDPVRARAEGRQPVGMDAETAVLFPASMTGGDSETPTGWRRGKIGDVASSTASPVDPRTLDPETPYIGLEHMPRGRVVLDEWGQAGQVMSGKARFQTTDVLFGKLRPYFRKVGIAPVSGVCSTDVLAVVPKSDTWLPFVLMHLSSDDLIERANACSTGTKMPRVRWGDIARFEIAVPPERVAAAYCKMVSPMLRNAVSSVLESRTLAALRDALLPKLLSGELRIRDAEKMVEDHV